MYSSDFNDWFPVTSVGSVNNYPSKVNYIGGIHYTRYIYSGAANTRVPITYTNTDQNLGYLYAGGMVPNPAVFFCPSFSEAATTSLNGSLSIESYSTPGFMSTDSGGVTRSSYMFNPRLASPTANSLRQYQKTSNVKALDVLTIDYLASAAGTPGVPFNINFWAHYSSKGVNTLFTDGSVKFTVLNNTQLNNIAGALNSDEFGGTWALQYNTLFNYLQAAP